MNSLNSLIEISRSKHWKIGDKRIVSRVECGKLISAPNYETYKIINVGNGLMEMERLA